MSKNIKKIHKTKNKIKKHYLCVFTYFFREKILDITTTKKG